MRSSFCYGQAFRNIGIRKWGIILNLYCTICFVITSKLDCLSWQCNKLISKICFIHGHIAVFKISFKEINVDNMSAMTTFILVDMNKCLV